MASALIAADTFPNAKVVFISPGTEAQKNFPAYHGQIWIDISPPKERIQQFLLHNAIVLDHHVSEQKTTEAFQNAGLGVFSYGPGISGATLAFQHLWLQYRKNDIERKTIAQKVHRLAIKAGIRDTFLKKNSLWKEACAQAEVLTFLPPEYWLERRAAYLSDAELTIGRTLLQAQEKRVLGVVDKAFKTNWGPYRIAIIPSTFLVSDAADILKSNGFKIIFGFSFSTDNGNPLMKVSVRGNINCAEFAKFFGGGGHKEAAGFSIKVAHDDRSPYGILINCLDEFSRTEPAFDQS